MSKIGLVATTQTLVCFSSLLMMCFYVLQWRKGRAGWEVLFVTSAEVFTYGSMLILGSGLEGAAISIEDPNASGGSRDVKWLRYAGWLVTCPVLLINLAHLGSKSGSNIIHEDEEGEGAANASNTKKGDLNTDVQEQYGMADMMVLLTLDEGMIIAGVTASFAAQGSGARIGMYIAGCACGILLYGKMFQIFFSTWQRHPYARQWVVSIAVLYFTSWLIYPVLWAIGPEGAGVIDEQLNAVGHGVADMIAKNTVGGMVWYLRQRIIPYEEKKLAEIAALGEEYTADVSKRRKRRRRERRERRRNKRAERERSEVGASSSKSKKSHATTARAQDDYGQGQDMHAVIVSPDPIYRSHISGLLQGEGYTVTASPTPDALHHELTEPYITLRVAILHGNSFKDYVKVHGRGSIPQRDMDGPILIAMAGSGKTVASAREEFMSIGAHEVLMEPYDRQALHEAFQRFKTPPADDGNWSQSTGSLEAGHTRDVQTRPHAHRIRGSNLKQADEFDDVDDHEPHPPNGDEHQFGSSETLESGDVSVSLEPLDAPQEASRPWFSFGRKAQPVV